MESIKELYRIGYGPSSSHTMGPRKAAEQFLLRHPKADKYEVTLFGSLAATGKGHLTGVAIEKVFEEKDLNLIWQPEEFLKRHPNALRFKAFSASDELIEEWTAYSIGGGAIIDDNSEVSAQKIYGLTTMDEILEWCKSNKKQLWEYVELMEGDGIWDYLDEVWTAMKKAVKRGMNKEGELPGGLELERKSHSYRLKAKTLSGPMRKRSMLYAFALAVSEENSSGGVIVTAPTCGACGVLPAVLYYHKKFYKFGKKDVLKALATAGLIGNLVKTNASISGAEVGCQGEVGTACAMASGAATQLHGGTVYQVEYSAEMGLEHHLGLTCDPVLGLVQIPCIERNVFAAARALNHNTYALLSDGRHRISFDQVTETMMKTGLDLPYTYKETSLGGLASLKVFNYK
ncbi:L-serine ammonia-lyase [Labilibaculum sp. A4]|uniref:L-serine dehydratase n=1 Tax=Labilibaculum euxinus TaxID=2686357 RepID=A0A425YA68_9BACT|nr:L-serine ammonia-lyase [Labilibaculum euxinus]MDQ1771313.1 L-serine ammonia-lyase [Labilibaculum euxinus]MUP38405.1 L-serine ammonia-lyase [Labilibaculum euxinus]MVB07610.1 L-serine ammonia-lyase [Labilibaculum euxinus]MWN77101.1 L-serine ammonia-lyase [Labilibaculum euxinus]